MRSFCGTQLKIQWKILDRRDWVLKLKRINEEWCAQVDPFKNLKRGIGLEMV